MRRNQEAANDVARQLRLLLPRRFCVEKPCAHSVPEQRLRSCFKCVKMLLLGRNVQGTVAAIGDRHTAVRGDAFDESVKKPETPDRQWQQGTTFVRLEVRSQYARR